jgi:hypothetical protein
VVLQQQAAVLLPAALAGGDVLQVERPGVGEAGGPQPAGEGLAAHAAQDQLEGPEVKGQKIKIKGNFN